MKICAFLWVYFGYPSSAYEGINVEIMRNINGSILARNDKVDVDYVGSLIRVLLTQLATQTKQKYHMQDLLLSIPLHGQGALCPKPVK